MFIEIFGNQKKMKRYNIIMNQTMIAIYLHTKMCRDAELHQEIVGHLPPVISRFTTFLVDHVETVTATLSSTHY